MFIWALICLIDMVHDFYWYINIIKIKIKAIYWDNGQTLYIVRKKTETTMFASIDKELIGIEESPLKVYKNSSMELVMAYVRSRDAEQNSTKSGQADRSVITEAVADSAGSRMIILTG